MPPILPYCPCHDRGWPSLCVELSVLHSRYTVNETSPGQFSETIISFEKCALFAPVRSY